MNANQIGGLAGVLGGLFLGGLGWYLGRYFARRQRGLDERYELIRTRARATAWQITFGAMVVMYFVLIFGVPITPILLLSLLYLVHLAGWTACVFFYQSRF